MARRGGSHGQDVAYAVMSFDEIAKELRCSSANVRNLYRSAMKKLRRNPRVMSMFEDFI